MKDYTVSVVIPVYKNWHLCQSLLKSLHQHEKDNIDEVIIVDDSVGDAEVEGGLDFWIDSRLLPVTVIRNEMNSGFTITSNNGLRYADKPLATKHVTFLISTDVLVNGKFVEQGADVLLGARKTLIGNRLLFGDAGWNSFGGRVFDYLEGWFLAATSDGWRDLGYFDENYAPFDYEDIDLSTTAKSKGYRLAPLNNPNLKHLGGQSIGYNPARETITKRNREYFRRKWLNE